MKLGVAISVFNKFEELIVLLDVLSKFDIVSNVVVVKNDPFDKTELQYRDIIESLGAQVIINSTYPYIPDTLTTNGFTSITNRIWESQRLGLLAASVDTDFVLHTHADGWILSEDRLVRLVTNIKSSGKKIGFRGPGFSYRGEFGEYLGKIDDHFYICDSHAVRSSSFLKRTAISYMSDVLNIHGLLALWILAEIGIENSIHYDDTKKWLGWNDEVLNGDLVAQLRPYVYDSEYQLLHCHIEDFPSDYGRALQVKLLSENSLKGQYIDSYIKKYSKSSEFVKADLVYRLAKMKTKLFFLGYDVEEFRINLVKMEDVLFSTSVSDVIKNYLRKIRRLLIKSKRNRIMIYPERLDDFYHRELDERLRK